MRKNYKPMNYYSSLIIVFLIFFGTIINKSSNHKILEVENHDTANLIQADFIYDSTPFPIPIPFRKGNFWGYCISRTEFITPIIFDSIRYFWDGRAAVQLHGLWGIIDTTGRYVIGPKYTKISSCIHKLIIGSIHDTLIFHNYFGDSLSTIVGPFEHIRMENFYDNILPVQNMGKYKFFNVTTGVYSLPNSYQVFSFYYNLASIGRDKFGVMNFVSGDTIVPFIYDRPIDFFYDRGMIIKDGKVGFINTKGEIIIPLKYEECTIDGPDDPPNGTLHFRERFARVELNDRYGYINTKGEEITEIKYDYAENFNNGLGLVEINYKYTAVDTSGIELFELQNFESICKTLKEYRIANDSYDIYNQKGPYDTIRFDRNKYQSITPYRYGFYRIKQNGKYGFVDYTGYEYYKD